MPGLPGRPLLLLLVLAVAAAAEEPRMATGQSGPLQRPAAPTLPRSGRLLAGTAVGDAGTVAESAGLGMGQLMGFEGIGRGVPMSCDAYPDLNFTEVVRSNLGGFGPDEGEEGLVLKAYDAQVRRHLHVVINADPTYRPYHKRQNGLQGRCGLINIATGTDVALRFSFRDAVTGVPAILPQVAFTFFDLDQCDEHHCVEFITVHNVSAYRLSPHTELMVLRPTVGDHIPTATFYATTAGDWFDNPRSKDSLTMEQMNRGVSVAFHHISQLSLTFGASAGNGARYLSFMGFPGLLCIGQPATAENHFAPAAGTAPKEVPPPVRWRPSGEEGNLSGSLTVDNVDWTLLESRKDLAGEFESALRQGIVEAAGEGVGPEDVEISLEPGTVLVRATVQPPRAPPLRDPAIGGAAAGQGGASAGEDGNWRARLANPVLLDNRVTPAVRAVPGVGRAASGPVQLTGWHLLHSSDPGAGEAVTGMAHLQNLSYTKLRGDPVLLQGIKAAMAHSISSTVGGGLTPEDVDLGLFAGAVEAHVAVRPPESGGASAAAAPGAAGGPGGGVQDFPALGMDASAARGRLGPGGGAAVAGPTGTGGGLRAGTAAFGRFGPSSSAARTAGAGAAAGTGPRARAAATAMAARLQGRGDQVCEGVASSVKAVPGISEVTTGGVIARDWQVAPVEDGGPVRGNVVVHNVDYELLEANPKLMKDFREGVRQAVAKAAGGGIGPGQVDAKLFAGNVVLRAMVSPSFGSRLSSGGAAASRLRGGALCEAVTREVRKVKGIRQAANLTMLYHNAQGGGGAGGSDLPSWRHLPSDSFEDASEGAVVSCTAEGLDYGHLLLSPSLLSRVEQAVRKAVASQAGGLLNPGDMTLSLHVGSVVAQVAVQPPNSAAAAVRQRLGERNALNRQVWHRLKKAGHLSELAAEGDGARHRKGLFSREALTADGQSSLLTKLKYSGYGLALLGLCILLFTSCTGRGKALPAGRANSRTREVYVYLPVGDSNSSEHAGDAEAAAMLLPVEVVFRDFHKEAKEVKFRYCDHGMRLTQEAPPRVASFTVNSFAKEKGVQPGWTVAKVGGRDVSPRERGEAVERLLKARLERLPPAPLRLEFETAAGQTRTILFDRQPLGLEFTKAAPFRVEHHKPDSLARECGVEVGWTLRQVGTVRLSSASGFESLMAYLAEGLRGLPQDPSGPRMEVEFVDPNEGPHVLFFQRQPLGLRLRARTAAPGRSAAVVVEGFDFNSHAKDRGAHAGWSIRRVGGQEVSADHSVEEVVKLLQRHGAHLPLWPLRMDFVPMGGSGTRTFYFDHQPLGLEFTKTPPLRVDHFKPDSLAQAMGVHEGWSLARVGDALITKRTGMPELMAYIQAGLDHLPQEPKGLRVDFLDAAGRRRRCYFQRRPLGLTLSKLSPTCVEGFMSNSYARERGVQVGWTVVRVGEQDLPPSTSTPQEAESLLEEQSAHLALWPLRVDFDAGRGTIRTLYFDHQPLDLTVSAEPPFRVERTVPGGYSAGKGVELGWTFLRVGHVVVDVEADRHSVTRALAEGSAHLPLPPTAAPLALVDDGP